MADEKKLEVVLEPKVDSGAKNKAEKEINDISRDRDIEININTNVESIARNFKTLNENVTSLKANLQKVSKSFTTDLSKLGKGIYGLNFESFEKSISNIENFLYKMQKAFITSEKTGNTFISSTVSNMSNLLSVTKELASQINKIAELKGIENVRPLGQIEADIDSATKKAKELGDELKNIVSGKNYKKESGDISAYFDTNAAKNIISEIITNQNIDDLPGLKKFGSYLTGALGSTDEVFKELKFNIDGVDYSLSKIAEIFASKNFGGIDFIGKEQIENLYSVTSSIAKLNEELDKASQIQGRDFKVDINTKSLEELTNKLADFAEKFNGVKEGSTIGIDEESLNTLLDKLTDINETISNIGNTLDRVFNEGIPSRLKEQSDVIDDIEDKNKKLNKANQETARSTGEETVSLEKLEEQATETAKAKEVVKNKNKELADAAEETTKKTQEEIAALNELAKNKAKDLLGNRDVISQYGKAELDDTGNGSFTFLERLQNGQTRNVIATWDDATKSWVESLQPVKTTFDQIEKSILKSDKRIVDLENQLRREQEEYGDAYNSKPLEDIIDAEKRYNQELSTTLDNYSKEAEYVYAISKFSQKRDEHRNLAQSENDRKDALSYASREEEKNKYLQIGAEKLAEQERKQSERLAAEELKREEEKNRYLQIGSEKLAEQKRIESERLHNEELKREEEKNKFLQIGAEKLAEQERKQSERLAEEKNKFLQIGAEKQAEIERKAIEKKKAEEEKFEEWRLHQLQIGAEKQAENNRKIEEEKNKFLQIGAEKQAENERIKQEADLWNKLSDSIQRYETVQSRIVSGKALKGDKEEAEELFSTIVKLQNSPVLSEAHLNKADRMLNKIGIKMNDIRKNADLKLSQSNQSNSTSKPNDSETTKAYTLLSQNELKIAKIRGDGVTELTNKQKNLLGIYEEQNKRAKAVLSNVTVLTKEETDAQEKYNNAVKEASQWQQDSFNSSVNNLQTIDFKDDLDELRSVENQTNSYTDSLKQLEKQIEDFKLAQENLSYDSPKNELKKVKNMADDINKNISRLKNPVDGTFLNKKVLEVETWLQNNTNISHRAKLQIEDYVKELKNVSDGGSLKEIYEKIRLIEEGEKAAGRAGISMGDKLKKSFGNLFRYLSTFASFYRIIEVIREAVNSVKELDTALTEMRKVSDASLQTLKNYQKETFGIANEVGSTALALQNATADWMRLGESIQDAAESAKTSTVLLNVSEFENINDATQALVSASQAYKELDKMDIVDVLNNIGNNYSVATDELAQGLQNAAAVLKTQHNDLNQAVALLTAGNAITQDISKTSAGIRTIALRISGTEEAKNQLAEIGEDTEDFIVGTSAKMQQLIKDYTSVASNSYKGFDILDDNGNFKSTYDILLGISKVYQEILETDKKAGTNRGQALVEALAGKNRSNIAASILNNPQMLEDVYRDAQNSAGSAQQELDKYLDSIEGHLSRFTNAVQEVYSNLLNSEFIKGAIDGGTSLIHIIDTLAKKVGLLSTAFVGASAFFGSKGRGYVELFGGAKKFFGKFTVSVDKYADILSKLNNISDKKQLFNGDSLNTEFLSKNIGNVDAKLNAYLMSQRELIQSDKEVTLTTNGMSRELQKSGMMFDFAAIKAALFSAALNAGISIAISLALKGLIKLYDTLAHKVENAKNSLSDWNDELSETKSRLADHKSLIKEVGKDYDELSKGVNTLNNTNISLSTEDYEKFIDINERLADAFPRLIVGTDENGKAILRMGDNSEVTSKKLEELLKKEERIENLKIKDALPETFKNAKTVLDDEIKNVEHFEKLVAGYSNALEKISNLSIDSESFSFIRDSLNTADAELFNAVNKSFQNLIDKQIDKELKTQLNQIYSNFIKGAALLGNNQTRFEIDFSSLENSEEIIAQFKNNLEEFSYGIQDSLAEAKNNLSNSELVQKQYWDTFVNDNLLSAMHGSFVYLSEDMGEQGREIADALVGSLNQGIIDDMDESDPYQYIIDNIYPAVDKLKDKKFNVEGSDKPLSFASLFDSTLPVSVLKNLLQQIQDYCSDPEHPIQIPWQAINVDEAINELSVYNRDLADGFDKKDTRDYNGRSHETAIKRLNDYTKDFNAEQMEAWENVTEGAKSATEAIERYNKYLDDANNKQNELANKPLSIPDFAKSTDEFEKLNGLYSTFKENTKNGIIDKALDISDIEALRETFGAFSEFESFEKLASTAGTSASDLQKSFNKLATEYANANFQLETIDDTNKDAIASQLDLKGATKESAQAFVDYYANLNKIKNNSTLSDTNQLQEQISLAKEMVGLGNGGNVDLTLRPTIDTSELEKAGWDNAGDGLATVFSSTFTNESETVAINFTPIMVDEDGNYKGTLSPDDLQKYAEEVIDGVHEDYLNLQIGAKFEGEDALSKAEESAERIHKLQEEFYDGNGNVNLALYGNAEALDVYAQQLGVTTQALAAYLFQETLASENGINTTDDVNALISLGKQAGYTTEDLEALNRILNLIAKKEAAVQAYIQNATPENEKRILNLDKQIDKQIEGFKNSIANREPVTLVTEDDAKNSGGKAGKAEGDEYVKKYEEAVKKLDDLKDKGLITERERLSKLRELIQAYFQNVEGYADEYRNRMKDWANQVVSYMESVIGGITKLIDRKINQANKGKDEAIKALEKEKEAAINAYDAQIKAIDKQIKAKQDEIDAIDKANQKRQQSIDLQQKEYALQQQMNQKTKLVKFMPEAIVI